MGKNTNYEQRKAFLLSEIERNEKIHCKLVAAKFRRMLTRLEKEYGKQS